MPGREDPCIRPSRREHTEAEAMDNITNNFSDVLLWSFSFFLVIGALFLWGLAFMDLFTDSTLGGWAKAGWAVLLILVPWVGVLIYLIARSQSKRKLAESIRAD
jgi:hypothetical protein